MITIADLVANGYRRWTDPVDKGDFYQKAYYIDGRRAFWMQVYAHDFSKFPGYTGSPIRFEINNQIVLADGNVMNVLWSPRDTDTVQDLEQYMLKYWKDLGGTMYD